jgi:DNA-binding CsgD family transcriptional regulator
MNYKSFLDKPFRLMSFIGIVYVVLMLLLNIFTDFSYELSIMPFSKIISYSAHGVALVLCALTVIFYNKHIFYYAALEVLIFSNLYTGRIYTALFLSSILFILMLWENKFVSKPKLIIYIALEVIKLILVVPYGVKTFFEYTGIILFSLCTIGCINLLFRHAYEKKDSGAVNLDNYRFSDRQKDCIKEIVLNNTTIKALAINHKVSESAIKKDLSHIYNVLGITGKADLKALFIGYQF